MPSPHSLREITALEPGDHLCCFYETEEERRAMLTPFLRQGLEGGEKVLYIVDAHTSENVLRYLRDDGLETEPYLARRQLNILTADECYMRDGSFDPDRTIALLRAETERAVGEGYAALRVTGEMTCLLREPPMAEQLIEYEAKLNEFFQGSQCLAICQYDRRRFGPALLLEILTTHPLVVIGKEIVNNFFYVPPKDLLNSDPPAARLARWLDKLVEGKRAEERLKREYAQRAETERALRTSEARYRELVQNANSIILRMDRDGVVTFFNEFAQSFFGYSEDEIIGRSVVGTIVPETDTSGRDLAAMIEDIGRHPERYVNNENENMRSNGERVRVAWTNRAVHDENGNIVETLCIGNDITERHRLQAQLLQAQKMEAVGTLAGGLSHDFNNLLQRIQGYVDLILLNTKSNQPGYRALKEIAHSVKRGGDLTQQLLTFSRKVESKLRPIDLNHHAKQAEKFLTRTITKMITIELHLEDKLNIVNADPAQIEQVLMNLSLNARDAMPDGGKLIIKTENVILDKKYCRMHPGANPGGYALLSVSDTGHGMDSKTVERVFEPFFSTKEPGRGSGLGLSMVYGIVKSHGGYITCASALGKGTVFTIYFPVIEGEAEWGESVEEVEMPEGGTETILLVDDEKSIRDTGKKLLSAHGYTALTAADGESALEVYRQRKRIDLAIVDLIMPGMGGRRCAEELLKTNPQLKIVIASGYSFDGPEKEALEDRIKGFISKPYEMEQILRVIRDVLDQE